MAFEFWYVHVVLLQEAVRYMSIICKSCWADVLARRTDEHEGPKGVLAAASHPPAPPWGTPHCCKLPAGKMGFHWEVTEWLLRAGHEPAAPPHKSSPEGTAVEVDFSQMRNDCLSKPEPNLPLFPVTALTIKYI